jgi:hypothetical protein
MLQAQDGGALGWLDRLGGTLVKLSSGVTQIKANLKAASTSDQTPAAANTPLQAGPTGIPVIWIVGGAALLVGGWLLLSRK